MLCFMQMRRYAARNANAFTCREETQSRMKRNCFRRKKMPTTVLDRNYSTFLFVIYTTVGSHRDQWGKRTGGSKRSFRMPSLVRGGGPTHRLPHRSLPASSSVSQAQTTPSRRKLLLLLLRSLFCRSPAAMFHKKMKDFLFGYFIHFY